MDAFQDLPIRVNERCGGLAGDDQRLHWFVSRRTG
jgi:hypothetical protein